MKKAVYMGICKQKVDHDQRMFMLDPPLSGYNYVIVSAKSFKEFNLRFSATTGMTNIDMPDETYIFGSDPSGEIMDWSELEGSYRGGMSHAQALQNAGYEIVESSESLEFPE